MVKIEEQKTGVQPELNIGLVGHIDHGKTTLLYRLTGKWTDTHSEELKRGITIKLGYADAEINGKKVSFVDAPGHEMLMATMLSGAAIIAGALLIIAANEHCPQPQTKEHLAALKAKDVKQIIIVQNKIDLVSKEEAKKNYNEIKAFVKNTIASNAKIIPLSAQQNIGLEVLKQEITKLKPEKRNLEEKPVFFVVRSFDINKPGTSIEKISGGVLGGCLKQGRLRKGEEIEIKPGLAIKKHALTEYKTLKTKIIAIMSGKSELEDAIPGGSLAIQTSLDPILTKSDSLAGCVVSKEGVLPNITQTITIKTSLFEEIAGGEKVEEIGKNEILLLSVNTAISVGRVKEIKKDKISLELRIPIVAIPGKIGIARNIKGHYRLIGYGELVV